MCLPESLLAPLTFALSPREMMNHGSVDLPKNERAHDVPAAGDPKFYGIEEAEGPFVQEPIHCSQTQASEAPISLVFSMHRSLTLYIYIYLSREAGQKHWLLDCETVSTWIFHISSENSVHLLCLLSGFVLLECHFLTSFFRLALIPSPVTLFSLSQSPLELTSSTIIYPVQPGWKE